MGNFKNQINLKILKKKKQKNQKNKKSLNNSKKIKKKMKNRTKSLVLPKEHCLILYLEAYYNRRVNHHYLVIQGIILFNKLFYSFYFNSLIKRATGLGGTGLFQNK